MKKLSCLILLTILTACEAEVSDKDKNKIFNCINLDNKTEIEYYAGAKTTKAYFTSYGYRLEVEDRISGRIFIMNSIDPWACKVIGEIK